MTDEPEEVQQVEQKAKQVEQVQVRVVKRLPDVAIVEVGTDRFQVPFSELTYKDDLVLVKETKLKKRYGVDFSKLKLPAVSSGDIERALHVAGIYTLEDIQKNSQRVVSVLAGLFGVQLTTLIEFASKDGD